MVPPPAGIGIGVGGIASWAAGKGGDQGMLTPGIADRFKVWNVTTLVGKEPERVWEVEQLDTWAHLYI